MEENDKIICDSDIGTSILIPLEGFDDMEYTINEPNTSLFFKSSGHPSSRANLSVGNHRLISLVGGIATQDEEWLHQPIVKVSDGTVTVIHGNSQKEVKL